MTADQRTAAHKGHPERVLGHLGINVPDLAAARSYYDVIMPLLDFDMFLDADDQLAYMPAGGKHGTYLFFYPTSAPVAYSRVNVGLQHLAFMLPTRQRVRGVHEAALALGSRELHPPQNWPQYPPPYFASFWMDPFGITLEAVCHHDR